MAHEILKPLSDEELKVRLGAFMYIENKHPLTALSLDSVIYPKFPA